MNIPLLVLSIGRAVAAFAVLVVNRTQRGDSTAAGPVSTKPAARDGQYWSGLLANRSTLEDPVLESQYDGGWFPQLSSKRVGLVANGVTYRPVDNWNDHDVLSGEYPGARLLHSGTWSTFSAPDFWVTVAGTSCSTSVEANAWCDAKGTDHNSCFAKMLSHTSGTEGTTVLR